MITSANPLLMSCQECGMVVAFPEIEAGQKAHCPRCNHLLYKRIMHPYQRVIAYTSACLIMLVLSVSFPFMSFSVSGLSQEITLLHAVQMLDEFRYLPLGMLLLATVIVLPGTYISLMLYLYLKASKIHYRSSSISSRQMRYLKYCCKLIFRIEPWLMVDVFLIGVLVSLVKISSLADIGMGYSFWTFCGYTVFVVKCVSLVDRNWLWSQFIPLQPVESVNAGDSHLTGNYLDCHVCHQINPDAGQKKAFCLRCGSSLHQYHVGLNLQKSWALLIAAVIFYIPANLYPMMYTVSLGSDTPSTIMGGIVLLWQMGSYPVAAVIFLASIVIPIAKIVALGWLFFSARKAQLLPEKEAIHRLQVYRLTEFIGRWSMIDIFVVSLMVALVQLQNLMSIYPGPAAISFATVVVTTMLSAMVFDPRVLWQTDIETARV